MRCIVLALVVAASLPVRAADASPAAEAEAVRLNDRGKVLFRAHKDGEAIDLFRRAYALHAKPSYLFNLALAAQQLEQCSTALAAFLRYIALTDSEEADPPTKQRAAARSRADALENECKPSKEFGDLGPADRGTTTPVDTSGDSKTNVGDVKPPGDAIIAPIQKPAPKARRSRVWLGLTIGGAVTMSGLVVLALYENGRIEDLTREATDAAAADGVTAPPGSNLCDQTGMSAELDRLCADGKKAADLANLATLGVIGVGVATAVFAYFAFIRKPTAEAAAGDIKASLGGPGDIGVRVRVLF